MRRSEKEIEKERKKQEKEARVVEKERKEREAEEKRIEREKTKLQALELKKLKDTCKGCKAERQARQRFKKCAYCDSYYVCKECSDPLEKHQRSCGKRKKKD
jgi:hypothetical protein